MIHFNTTILQFGQHGEKTGWTYIFIPADLAGQLNPGNKKSFRVKGKLDKFAVRGIALLPMGAGDFIMPLNQSIRKRIKKGKGAILEVKLDMDKRQLVLNPEFLECLADEPAAEAFFQSLPKSVQNYFSKWIESAKTEATRTRRISQAVNALARKMNFSEMLRALKKDKEDLGRI